MLEPRRIMHFRSVNHSARSSCRYWEEMCTENSTETDWRNSSSCWCADRERVFEVRMAVFALVATLFVGASLGKTEYEQALVSGAKAKVVFEVRDENHKPVERAYLCGCFRLERGGASGAEFEGLTDKDGLFTVEGKTQGKVCYQVLKKGYYGVMDYEFDLSLAIDESAQDGLIASGRWQPYGQKKKVLLKRILNPSLGNFKRMPYKDIPAYDRWIGVDLEVFDWLPPYGKGVCEDALLRFTTSGKWHAGKPFSASMEMSFTNQPFAGVYIRKKECSQLKSCHLADTNDMFLTRVLKYERLRNESGTVKNECFTEDEYLVFRTRTRIDEKGRLLSANYGKIYGSIGYVEAFGAESVLFNSKLNDPNLEESDAAKSARMFLNMAIEHGAGKWLQ